MVDTRDLKSLGSNPVLVRVQFRASQKGLSQKLKPFFVIVRFFNFFPTFFLHGQLNKFEKSRILMMRFSLWMWM